MKLKHILLIIVLFTVGCQPKPAPAPTALPATPTVMPPTETSAPTATPVPTDTPAPTETPAPTAAPLDPDLFGALNKSEVQMSFAMEPIVQAVFENTMQKLVAAGQIEAFQVDRVTIFPGANGLATEVIFRVKTADTQSWLSDGGMLSADGWITDKCAHFDWVVTADQYQLRHKQMCS